MKLQKKIDENVWDKIEDFANVYKKMRNGDWSWIYNSKCKYVELRVDMRNGGCIISDRSGTRIDPKDLEYQFNKEEVRDE